METSKNTKANCVIANLAQLSTSKEELLSGASTWDFLSNLSVTSEEDKKRYKARADTLKARAKEIEMDSIIEPTSAKILYPDYVDGDYGPGDYQPIIDSFGTVILQVDDDDYQGDTRVLYHNGDIWGYLQFGWGSCSGCDALQATNSLKELDDLIRELHQSIRWSSKEEMLQFFQTHDWEGDYSYHSREQKKFISKAVRILNGGVSELA